MQSDTNGTVLIVDDDVSVRESLDLLIQSQGWNAQAFASAAEFLARPTTTTASCLLLDVNLPDLNGLEVQERIAADRSSMPVIFVTGYGDIPTTVRAMKAGAAEFLTKPFNDDVLLRAVGNAIEQSRAAIGEDALQRELRGRYFALSARERQVMDLVVTGLLNKQVGADLGISEIAVKAHRGRAMQKMNARALAELVTMAARLRSDPLPQA